MGVRACLGVCLDSGVMCICQGRCPGGEGVHLPEGVLGPLSLCVCVGACNAYPSTCLQVSKGLCCRV